MDQSADYLKKIYTEPAMNALCKSSTRVEFKVLCLILMQIIYTYKNDRNRFYFTN